MNIDMGKLTTELAAFWDTYGLLITLGLGVLGLALVIASVVLLYKAKNKAKWIDTLAAVVVMLWTSEGLVQVALRWNLPPAFIGIAFFVFEALMLSSGMEAEDHRKRKGVPGPAGKYVFLIAATSGFVASFGSDNPGLQLFRIVLPVLAVGRWWISLSAERDTDTDEMKAERKRLRDEREATWAITPRTLLIHWGLMKPGRTTTSDAQREHQVNRMTVLADEASTLKPGRARRRKLRKLRRLTRTATEAMVAEVALRVERADSAEELMLPARRQTGNTTSTPGVTTPDNGASDGPNGARAFTSETGTARVDGDAPRAPFTGGERAPYDARSFDGDAPHASQDDSAHARQEAGARASVPAARARRPRGARVDTRRLVPGPRGGRAQSGEVGGERAGASARAEAAYSQYTTYVEEKGAEPDGTLVADWVGVTHAASGRRARAPWRVRMAKEIADGTRARPTELPGEIAALLPPQVRTRASDAGEDGAQPSAPSVDARVERAPDERAGMDNAAAPDTDQVPAEAAAQGGATD